MKKYLFGLIGYPLTHSFSKKYFNEKFKKEGLEDHFYELFSISDIKQFPELLTKYPNLTGLNVTIPYKEAVIPFLNEVEDEAQQIGAVNTIRIRNGQLKGFNTDVYGFEKSLFKKINIKIHQHALILGTGGAAKAVAYILKKNNITYQFVSRTKKGNQTINYSDITGELLQSHLLIINTTPLGMLPRIASRPHLPYDSLTPNHLLYDLVYNPARTQFLLAGEKKGAATINGLDMLHLQAEKAWEIWNQKK